MKKSLTIALVTLLLVSLVAAPALAGKGGGGNGGGKKNGQSGKSNVGHLYLYEKDPTSWEPVEEGAWGKMQYRLSGPEFDFVFNGHGLEAELEYTLLYYPDPWPGNGLICLSAGVADEFGNVHLANEVDTGDLPSEADENDGAKIWLVLTADVDCSGQLMGGWNPSEYLFEADLITFDDTDVP